MVFLFCFIVVFGLVFGADSAARRARIRVCHSGNRNATDKAASKQLSLWQEKYRARGLRVFDIAINPNADLLVENFAKDYRTSFPVGWSTLDQMVSFMGFSSSDRSVVPQLVLIDRKGQIRYQTPATSGEEYARMMIPSEVEKQIEKLRGESRGR